MNPTIVIKARGRADLEILLGEAGSLTGGVGGWAKVGRPRRLSLTDWVGADGYEMSVPVVFDGLAEDRSVERPIARLERLGRRPAGNDHPPILTLAGPLPHTELAWVLQNVEWGASERREDGQRIRQFATLVFWQHIDPDITIQRKKSPAKRAQDRRKEGKKKSNRTYTVKRGDTLASIAARKLGAAKRWREIADLNNIRDPKKIKVGRVLRLP